MAFSIESDGAAISEIQGGGTNTQGDWTTGTNYPIIASGVAPNTAQVVSDYQIAYFPTIYLICPNRKVTELPQPDAAGLYNAVLGCPTISNAVNDASIFSCPTPNAICGEFVPSLTIQNYGSAILTTCTITAKVDGVVLSTYNWTGSLARFDIAEVTLPTITGVTNGTHTLTYELSNPNNTTDEDLTYNILEIFINGAANPITVPVIEGFESSTFPPSDWTIDNPNGDGTWKQSNTSGGFGNSTKSVYIDFFNLSEGNTDDIYTAPIDLSNVSKATMLFNIAHAQYDDTYQDQLDVMISTDCGQTWTTAWSKTDPDLATAPATTSEFVPSANQWRTDTVDLSQFLGQSKVFIKFHAISGYSNDLYIDDINIIQNVGINEEETIKNNITVYPNPSTTKAIIEFSLDKPEPVSLEIFNLLGEKIFSIEENIFSAGVHNYTIDVSKLNQGIYYLNVIINRNILTKRLDIIKNK